MSILDDQYDYIVIELSSYQLHHTKNIRLDYGIILNIASDHLDWHGSIDDYIKAKRKLFSFVKNERVIFYDNIFSTSDSRKIYISKVDSSKYNFQELNLPITLSLSFLDMINFLNLENGNLIMKGYEFLKTFNTIEHRFEDISFNDEVTYINDSKATNFHAVSSAISRVKNAILILHGPVSYTHLTLPTKRIV